MLAHADESPVRTQIQNFRITEIGDDALMLLFCPTSQTIFRELRLSVP